MGQVLHIKCPFDDCKNELNELEVGKHISTEDFEKYKKFKKNAILS